MGEWMGVWDEWVDGLGLVMWIGARMTGGKGGGKIDGQIDGW